MNLYTELVNANCQIDSHESDLYALVTPVSTPIVEKYSGGDRVRTFRSQIDGRIWFDLPFAFIPFWEKRARG